MGESLNILILSIPGIGNTVMITPMLQRIIEEIPEARITVLVTLKGSEEILQECPFISKVIRFDGRMLRGCMRNLNRLAHLRLRHFDFCITAFPANDLRYNILAYLIGAKCMIGHLYPTKRMRTLSFLQKVRVPMSADRHDVLQNLDLLEPLGITTESSESFRMKLWVGEDNLQRAKLFLRTHRIHPEDLVIGVHPGSSTLRKMIHKRWPKQRFAALMDLMLEEYPCCRLLLFGGPEEENLRADIVGMMHYGYRVVTVDGMCLLDVASIVRRCDLFVSNDSSLMHVASAVGVPTVAIFGPTDPLATHPFGVSYALVTMPLKCGPCWSIEMYGARPDCQACPPYTCIRDLAVETVAMAARELLEQTRCRDAANAGTSRPVTCLRRPSIGAHKCDQQVSETRGGDLVG